MAKDRHGSAAGARALPQFAEAAFPAVLAASRLRGDIAPDARAALTAALNEVVAQLEIDAAAVRAALSGPDPQYACRVALDAMTSLNEGLAFADEQLAVALNAQNR